MYQPASPENPRGSKPHELEYAQSKSSCERIPKLSRSLFVEGAVADEMRWILCLHYPRSSPAFVRFCTRTRCPAPLVPHGDQSRFQGPDDISCRVGGTRGSGRYLFPKPTSIHVDLVAPGYKRLKNTSFSGEVGLSAGFSSFCLHLSDFSREKTHTLQDHRLVIEV